MTISAFFGLVLPCILDGMFITVILQSVASAWSGRWSALRNRPDYPVPPAPLPGPDPGTAAAESSLAELKEVVAAARAQADKLHSVLSDCEIELLNGAEEALRDQAPAWLAGSRDLADQFRRNMPDVADPVIGKVMFITFFYINQVANQLEPGHAVAVIRNALVGAAVDLTAVERQSGVT